MTELDTADQAPPPTFAQPPRRYDEAFYGFSHVELEAGATEVDWPNSVKVDVTGRSSAIDLGDVASGYADVGAHRQLVEVDTNYKPCRPGPHPVALTREDAVRFAAAVLRAAAGTFDPFTVGTLRALEAAELLAVLGDVDAALSELRDQALEDLQFELKVAAQPRPAQPGSELPGSELPG